LSTGGACIAPSGVQKERMQPHEIFVVPLALCSGGDSVTQGAAGAASLSIDFYHFVRKQGFPFPPPPPPLPLSFPSPPFSSLPPLRSLDPKGLKISQCTPLFQVIYRLRSGLQPFQTTLNPYRMYRFVAFEASSCAYRSGRRYSFTRHLHRTCVAVPCEWLGVSLH
jgi:hypothetical protein